VKFNLKTFHAYAYPWNRMFYPSALEFIWYSSSFYIPRFLYRTTGVYHSLWTYRNINNRSNLNDTSNIQKTIKEKGAFCVKVTQWWSNGTQIAYLFKGKTGFKVILWSLAEIGGFPYSCYITQKKIRHRVLKPSRNPTAIAGMCMSFQHATSFCHRHWLVNKF